MLRATSIVAALTVPLIIAGCSYQASTGPDIVTSASAPIAVTARIQPDRLNVSSVATAACPSVPPLITSFNVVITSQSVQPLTVDQVTFHFLDGSSVSTQPITFPGGALIPTNGMTMLPFSPQFGCGIGAPQWVVGEVKVHDSMGREQTVSVRAPTH